MASGDRAVDSRRRRRRRVLAVGGSVLAAVIVFVVLYFEPQTLFIDDEVDETLPGIEQAIAEAETTTPTTVAPTSPAAATTAPTSATESTVAVVTTATAGSTTASPSPTQPPVTDTPAANSLSASLAAAQSSGQPVIVSSGTFFSGEHETKGTAYVVALPDGAVVVRFEDLDTSNGPDLRVVLSPDEASDAWKYDGRVHLGELKGNIGDQNYDLKADIDLTQFRSVVIWCERFSVAFGAAPITVVA